MKAIAIQSYMTPAVATIGDEQPLREAQRKMEAMRVRHLPVLHGGELVGVLSERDVLFALGLPGLDPRALKVADAMIPEPFSVAPETPLFQVAAALAERRYGAALVCRGSDVLGIFTTTDALRALADLAR